MTSVLKRIGVLAITFALLLSCFTACNILTEYESETESETAPEEEPIEYTLTLKADKTVATRGESVNLSAALTAEGEEDIPSEDTEYIIVSGSEYATISGDVLKISSSAPHGATVTVQAKEGASYSNTVSIKIDVPLKSIVISAATDKPTAGQTVVLTKVVDPSDATQTITWSITEGADYATLAGDTVTISETAEVGAVIKIKAVSGDVESNELTLTVRSSVEEIPAESVSITAPTLNPLVGDSVVITGQIRPDNSTDSIRYEITDGSDFATLSANVLIISKDATAGVVIKVVAYAGDVQSNELVFTVRDNQVAAESIEIYANNYTPLPGQSVVISKDVKPQNTTDAVVWTIVDGADKATMSGDVLMINSTAAAGDVIKVMATAGGVESNVLEFVVASTEVKANKVTISAEYLNLLPGQTMIIQSVIEPANSTDDIVMSITDGAQYASFAGNVLIVSENAPAGTVIKVVAKAGAANSNELVFTVRDTSVPATKVEISADNLTPIAGHSVTINYTITPADTTDRLAWVIVEGSEIASMAGNVLVINGAAEKDSVIKVKAVVGNVESDVLTFTVRPATEEIKVESIEISANTQVLRGQTVALNKIINPDNANQEVVWQFVKGSNYARFHGDAIIISDTAPTGTEITIIAATIDGAVTSRELTLVVQPSQEEINANRFFIDLSKDIFTLDKMGNSNPVLIAAVYNYNYELVTDKVIEFKVIEGAANLGITPDGTTCTLSDAKGHGTAVIEIRIQGTDIVETAEVNVIVPPEAVVLPEVFAERTDIEYSFSLIDHTFRYWLRSGEKGEAGEVYSAVDVAGTATLPFVPGIKGTNVCQDIVVSFRHESGKTGNEVAVYDYETGAITFNMTGKVVVTVTSASGSKIEATTSYTFNINDGYNVNTFAELQQLLLSADYNGQVVNVVVLEKPVGTTCTVAGCYCGNNEYHYGYDIVPPTALKDHKDQTVYEILKGHPYGEANGLNSNRIIAENKSLYINGNSHTIDISQMRRFTTAEFNAAKDQYGFSGNPNIGSMITAEPWYATEEEAARNENKTYRVGLYNVVVKGNAPIDYDPNDWRASETDGLFVGIFQSGINVGNQRYNAHYYVDANGLTSSSFATGLSLTGVVGNGTISNINVYNCYSTGILARKSIVTLENITLGRCGATGIELDPYLSNKAGLNNNEQQQVTISGTINASQNLNAGNTTYFQNYKMNGIPVTAVIEGVATGVVTQTQQIIAQQFGGNKQMGELIGTPLGMGVVRHIQNENKEFIFVSLQFHDAAGGNVNYSTVRYAEYQAGGIITIEQLMTDVLTNSVINPQTGEITSMYVDTTHQFIEFPIVVNGQNAGTALFYNHNYGK